MKVLRRRNRFRGEVWVTVKLQFDKWFKRTEELDSRSPEEGGLRVVNLALDNIVASPYQTRTEFDELELKELAQSIKEFGVIQPIVVRQTPGGYELVAGERRVRASRLQGLSEIPALIVEMDDEKAAAVTLIENIQRTALNYLEEAEAYQLLINEFAFKQEELAKRVGKSQSTIANKLRLLKLAPEIRDNIRVDMVSERHARALLQLSDVDRQLGVLQAIIEKGLTVKATEELVKKLSNQSVSHVQERAPEDQSWLAARAYINNIKEIVYKAKENGVNIVCLENRQPEGYELLIKVNTNSSSSKKRKNEGA